MYVHSIGFPAVLSYSLALHDAEVALKLTKSMLHPMICMLPDK